jgi:hypothetical protein
VYRDENLELWHGHAADYEGRRPDLIFTNPQAWLPKTFSGVPMLLHQRLCRKRALARWAHVHERDLHLISLWNNGREAFWTVNIEVPCWVELGRYVPDPPGRWPLGLADSLLEVYGTVGGLLWDGFMGRGTGAKAALGAGMYYVGIECRSEAIELARAYLHLAPAGV